MYQALNSITSHQWDSSLPGGILRAAQTRSRHSVELYALTDDVATALNFEAAGVTRVFLDLETLGKDARQPGGNTVISHHRLNQIERIRNQLTTSDLIVRIDPLNPKTGRQVSRVLDQGADAVMLPMFRTMDEVERVAELVKDKAALVPLCETPESLLLIKQLCSINEVTDLHIGLNDLHLAREDRFMFEIFLEDSWAAIFEQATKPIGFGGISTLHAGVVPGRLVMAEHAARNSNGVILSRSFIASATNLNAAIRDMMKWRDELLNDPSMLQETRRALHGAIRSVIEGSK